MKYSTAILFISCFLIGKDLSATDTDTQTIDTVTVNVTGTRSDARFVPAVVQINPADVIEFVVIEGLHTVTAYHPDNRRPLRMPESAEPFDSGLLQKSDTWLLSINKPGVFDYFCLPHEKMGHAGRIISGPFISVPDYPEGRIPKAVLEKLNTETNNLTTKHKSK